MLSALSRPKGEGGSLSVLVAVLVSRFPIFVFFTEHSTKPILLQILQTTDSILGDGTAPIGMGSHEVSCFVHDETAETAVVPD